jgi:hypothetical protein
MSEPDPGLASLLQTKVEQNGGYIRNSHKVLIYIEHHSVCPLFGIGTPTPFAAGECSLPPPRTKGQRVGGAHSPAAKGVGESQFRRLWRKSLALCLLCGNSYRHSTYCAFISYTYVVGILRFTFTVAMYVYVRHLFCVPLDVCENGKHFDKL